MTDGEHAKKRPGWRARYREWRHELSESQREVFRFAVIGGALAVLAAAAYFWGGPAWRGWRHRQALAQAFDYAEQQDYRNSMLALKRATDLAPLDLATWREVSARLTELGSPQAVTARENMVRLAPGDASLRLALVGEALRFGQFDTAGEALRGLDEAARADAGFHRLAAALAMVTGESAQLEAHLEALVAAVPADKVARFNLAALRIWSLEPERQASALAELEALTAEPEVRVRAGLELLKHAARSRDAGRARSMVDLLLSRFGVGEDAALVSASGAPPGWDALVRALQAGAVRGGASDVALVTRWMGDVRLRAEALDWLDTLPAEATGAPPVMRAAAALSAELEDYDRLEKLLRAGALGPLPPDAIRLAIAARLQRGRYQAINGRATWDDAVAACRLAPSALFALAQLAELWRDPESGEQALLAILKVQSQAHWVYPALRDNYLARKDMARLWQLYATWVQARPDDPAVARIWLMLGAVLDRTTPEMAVLAKRRADSLAAEPIDRALAAALAWRRNQRGEAEALLASLSAEARQSPDVAFWVAVLLADTDRREEARVALAQARRAGLSAEETALLDKAAKQIAEKRLN